MLEELMFDVAMCRAAAELMAAAACIASDHLAIKQVQTHRQLRIAVSLLLVAVGACKLA
jgi:hypothetical protein